MYTHISKTHAARLGRGQYNMPSEARSRVWSGKIYLCIEVNEPISYGLQEYLLDVNRISYLYIYLPQVLAYFDKFLDHTKEGTWWFTSNGIVIPPTKPIGLIYDMHCSSSPSEFPWRLELHKGTFPADHAMDIDSIDDIKGIWNNQLKESCYINNGNTKPVMVLPQKSHECLWNAIVNSKDTNQCKEFWNIADQIFKPKLRVPLKIYYKIDDKWIMKQHTLQWTDKLGDLNDDDLRINKLLTHGVKLRSGLNVASIYNAFSYPDGFLHVVVKNEQAPSSVSG